MGAVVLSVVAAGFAVLLVASVDTADAIWIAILAVTVLTAGLAVNGFVRVARGGRLVLDDWQLAIDAGSERVAVPWLAISAIERRRIGLSRVLHVKLMGRDAVSSEGLAKVMLRRPGRPEVNLPLDGLDVTAEAATDAVVDAWNGARLRTAIDKLLRSGASGDALFIEDDDARFVELEFSDSGELLATAVIGGDETRLPPDVTIDRTARNRLAKLGWQQEAELIWCRQWPRPPDAESLAELVQSTWKTFPMGPAMWFFATWPDDD